MLLTTLASIPVETSDQGSGVERQVATSVTIVLGEQPPQCGLAQIAAAPRPRKCFEVASILRVVSRDERARDFRVPRMRVYLNVSKRDGVALNPLGLHLDFWHLDCYVATRPLIIKISEQSHRNHKHPDNSDCEGFHQGILQ
jgi:hypothetical protein